MNYLKALKQFIIKYKHAVVLCYFFIYMIWFTYLERNVRTFTTIHTKLDDIIPFNEYFIIPYMLWFFYIAITVIYFLFTSKQDYYKLCANLFIGMTICLTIYTIFPNGTHDLRPNLDTLGRSNIFITMLSNIYKLDTPTNVFPSIHVFNSVAALIAISKNERLRKIKWLQWGALILTILISMSTVFLKQHSVLDVFGALTLNTVMYVAVYVTSWVKETKRARQELSNI